MNDPLNVSVELAGVETTIPLLPDADYPVQVAEATIDANKDKSGLNLNLKLVTLNENTSTDGRTVKPNFPLFTVAALQAREDSKDVEAFKRSLGEIVDALFGTTKADRPVFNRDLVTQMIGKQAIATVYADEYPKGSGQFNNKVRRLKKAT